MTISEPAAGPAHDLPGVSHNRSWYLDHDIRPAHWQSHRGLWAAPQHYTCSYMAMFPPQLPHYFIERFTDPGDLVLDPFCGRGTTPVEAAALGRVGLGNDLNVLAVALARGKLANPALSTVENRIRELRSGYEPDRWKDHGRVPERIKMIYHETTLSQLLYLQPELDCDSRRADQFLTMVLMGAMQGATSGYLSLPMPNTFSMGWNYVAKYIDKNNLVCPERDAFEVLLKRVRRYLRRGRLPGRGRVVRGDAKEIDETGLADPGSVRLLFTSPPYRRVIKYGQYNWIRLWWLIGDHSKVDEELDDAHGKVAYRRFMLKAMESALPLLDRKRGLSCWVVGDVSGENLALDVWEHAASQVRVTLPDGSYLRYRLLGIVEDRIEDENKVTKIWNSFEDKSGKATDVDRILLLAPETATPAPLRSADEVSWVSPAKQQG